MIAKVACLAAAMKACAATYAGTADAQRQRALPLAVHGVAWHALVVAQPACGCKTGGKAVEALCIAITVYTFSVLVARHGARPSLCQTYCLGAQPQNRICGHLCYIHQHCGQNVVPECLKLIKMQPTFFTGWTKGSGPHFNMLAFPLALAPGLSGNRRACSVCMYGLCRLHAGHKNLCDLLARSAGHPAGALHESTYFVRTHHVHARGDLICVWSLAEHAARHAAGDDERDGVCALPH